MVIWIISGMSTATDGYETMNSAEQAGTVIGSGFAFMFILTIWVIGDIILGIFTLLTRPKS